MIGLPLLAVPAIGIDPPTRFGGLGDPGTRLLSGPPEADGAETLASHSARFGRCDPWSIREVLHGVLRESRLEGRGGGAFPLARKLDTARLAGGEPLVVVNGSESEPASRKDQTLMTYRPHLVLDGAAAVAAVVGATEVAVHLHRNSVAAGAALARAIAARRSAGWPDPRWRLSVGPDRYVSGEASAIASLLGGGEARPAFSAVPMARRGPSGCPTVVSNAETVAHVGLLAHRGWPAWQAGSSPSSPGPHLFTLAGAVPRPGQVLELVGRASVGELLAHAGLPVPPAGVLVGGYAGTWIEGRTAWDLPLDRSGLDGVGARLGCGLVGVVAPGGCGLTETARLVAYLAGETAGQCGPCVYGLPALARSFAALAEGTLRRRGLGRLLALADMIDGGGACRHPDGTVQLVRSALLAFGLDVEAHVRGRVCDGAVAARGAAGTRPPGFD